MSESKAPGYDNGRQQQALALDTKLNKSLIDLCVLLHDRLQMPFVTLLTPRFPNSTTATADPKNGHMDDSMPLTNTYKILCQFPNPTCRLKDPIGNWPTDKLKVGEFMISQDIQAVDLNDPLLPGEGFPIFNLQYRFLLLLPFSGQGLNIDNLQNEGFIPSNRVLATDPLPFILCIMDKRPRQLTVEEIEYIGKITDIISGACYAAAKYRGLQLQLRQLRHDLRTPLTSMTMIPQILQDDPALSQENLQMLAQILIAARKMNDLLDTTYSATSTSL